jgi:eukaryotic-like serine/threonine-protein kinase
MAMPSAPQTPGATNAQSIPPAMTLRALLDARRAEGRRMSLEEAVAVIVPVCLDLQTRHARSEKLYVHPSAIAPGTDGLARVNTRLSVVPTNAFDKHCIAPELQRTLEPGDARASVFSLGAILYEMVTGQHIGPAMKRPRDIEPSLPESIEILIGKSIIGDPQHRPGDLGALASALSHVAPQKSIHPPDISAARLDASAELDVDVKFSMLPPAERGHAAPEVSGVNALPRPPGIPTIAGAADPYGGPVIDRTSAPASGRKSADDPTARLGALKARLEADPRPRYVVSKDKMDHGPFSAVELLQQIASHAFTGDHGLRDEISGQSLPIAEWEEFAPFAVQTGLMREKRAEEKAVVRAADADKKRGVAKSIIAASVVLALGGVLAVWFFKVRGTHSDDVTVAGDRVGNIEINGDIKGKKKGPGGGPGGGGGPGYSGGSSFESILNGNNETITMGQGQGQDQPDLTNAQLSAPLRHASFITGCGAPDDMKVMVRVAVKMGRAVGVTISTNPPSAGVAACVDRSVRGLQWPVSPKTDFVNTSY